ncbi:MAG TPA: glycosyltransferase family 1 protein, partial [Armatimonadota bacterium]|nr:glycosyltransferase family 1 protein [Armatimonadota bacterium]
MKIAIDLRMLRHSGITSYLVNTVPYLIRDHPEAHFYLLGDPQQMAEHAWTRAENVTCIECIAPIYSLSEQWKVARRVPRECDLLWCPHYNIP